MAFAEAVAALCLSLPAFAGTPQSSSVRFTATIPVTTAALAEAVGSGNTDRSLLLLDVVRILFDAPDAPQSTAGRLRVRVVQLLQTPAATPAATVPLPLSPDVWRAQILETPVPDAGLIAAILGSRTPALLYFGLSALDDETLAWIAADRALLTYFRKHPGAFAAFGRSVRIRGGRMEVPGGSPAIPFWRDAVGADPASPSAFVRALFQSDGSRVAFLYDTIAHLDPAHRAFALSSPAGALADTFRDVGSEWDAELSPFARPRWDPSLLLMAARLEADGRVAGPAHRDVWERVFRDDTHLDLGFREVLPWRRGSDERVDAAWLARRIHGGTYAIARRRLETFFYGQRVLDDAAAPPSLVASVLRAYAAMPALMVTLERIGVKDPAALLAAARHARDVHGAADRELALTAFQSALALLERGVRSRALTPAAARTLVSSLVATPLDDGRGYDERIAAWLRADLFRSVPPPPLESTDPIEEGILRALAGAVDGRTTPIVTWEERTYRVDPAAAELERLRRVRERQGGPSLDTAIANLLARDRARGKSRDDVRRAFASTLVSVVYAAYLGDPDGPAMAAENVALKHDLGLVPKRAGSTPMTPWKLPAELFGASGGWHVEGSILALDMGLRRLSLRRLDVTELPRGPTMPVAERQTLMLATALANPFSVSDAELDRAAAALARGRSRIQALRKGTATVDEIAASAALSEWRREALRWALAHAPEEVDDAFSLVETLWLGGATDLDAWGAAAHPVTGCVCLAMPAPIAWENLTGHPAAGLLATMGADVALRLADVLAARHLPAALMPATLAFAMQDVLDNAQTAHFDDWPSFGRAARAIPDAKIEDYIAALTANGPLVPASHSMS